MKRGFKRGLISFGFLVLVAYGLVSYVDMCSKKYNPNKITKEYFKQCIWRPYYSNTVDLNKWYREENVDVDYKLYEKMIKERNSNLEGIIYLPDLNYDGRVGEWDS